MNVLITGGTGSFGQAFLEAVKDSAERIVVYSRDEHKQYDMQQKFSGPNIRYFIGDVRDKDRLKMALCEIDTVIHAAALKHVPTAEYNPFEVIKTNILGAQNLIEACMEQDFDTPFKRKVIALSTDKAAAPVNLYGATKLCADKLFIAANNMVGKKDLTFNVVRYGNVFGSRGSVVPMFMGKDSIPVTDIDMTRFSITLDQAVKFVLRVLEADDGGLMYVPKMPSYRLEDLVKAVAPKSKIKKIGLRPGEKIHEELITESESRGAVDWGDYFVVGPDSGQEPFSYNSRDNDWWLNVAELKEMVRDTLYPTASVT